MPKDFQICAGFHKIIVVEIFAEEHILPEKNYECDSARRNRLK